MVGALETAHVSNETPTAGISGGGFRRPTGAYAHQNCDSRVSPDMYPEGLPVLELAC